MTEQTLIPAGESAPRPLVLYTSLEQYQPARELMESAAVLLVKSERFKLIPSDADAELASEFYARLNQTIKDLDAARLKSTEEHRKLVEKMNAEAGTKLVPMKAVLERVGDLLKAHQKQKQEAHAKLVQQQKDEAARLAREKEEADQKARAANETAQKASADAEAARVAAAQATGEEERAAAQAAIVAATAAQEAAITTAAQEATKAVQLDHQQDSLANLPMASAPSKSIRGTYGSSTGLRDNWVWELVDIKLVPEEYLKQPKDRLAASVLNAKAKSVKEESTTAVPGIRIYNDATLASRAGR